LLARFGEKATRNAYVTGEQAKINLKAAGQLAALKHLLKKACSKYPNPEAVQQAGEARIYDLWKNKGMSVFDACWRVINEAERENVDSA